MERKIGEIFEYEGKWYQCINTGNCSECAFTGKRCYDFSTKGGDIIGDCTGRTFKKLEKVGEPYMDGGKIMQKYKRVYREPIYFPYKELNCYNDLHGRICIEIKQTKEDMEEKKLNLKPFDLQKAKEGKSVCTKDGRKARIICFDRNDLYPIVALIECKDGKEMIGAYSKDGCTEIYEIKGTDLMMLPEKKEGWVNVYNNPTTHNIYTSADVFESKEIAEEQGTQRNRIATCKITWEG